MPTILLPLAIPAALGLLALLLSPRRHAVSATLGVVGMAATVVTSLTLIGTSEALRVPLFDLAGLNVDIDLHVGPFASWGVAFVALLGLGATLYSIGAFRHQGGAPGRYYAYVLLAEAGGIGVLLSANLILMVVCWELVTLMLFLLVVSGRDDAGPGAAKAFAILALGDTALLVGVLFVGMAHVDAGHANPLSMATLVAHPMGADSALAVAAYLLLLLAAMAKAGAIPLHSWIPTMSTKAHAAVMAFLPGSLDKVLGIYLVLMISLAWFVPSPAMRMAVMLVGVVTMLGAVFMAMVQHDLRRLLSFHAVSQVGYMLLGIGTGTVLGVIGGVFHLVNNAIYKACLFLGAGEVERESGTMELGRLGGLVKTFPITFGSMFVAALAISGIPPLNGFASKWLVYQSCIDAAGVPEGGFVAAAMPIFLVAAVFASALTLASFVKVLHSVFWGPRPAQLDGVHEERNLGVQLPMVTLAVLCVVLGVFAIWPIEHAFEQLPGATAGAGVAVTTTTGLEGATATWPSGAAAEQSTAVFAPLATASLLFFGLLVALFLGYLGNLRVRRIRSVFVGGEAIDRNLNRFPGTEFYRTVQQVPGLGKALEVGGRGDLDPYDAGARVGAPVVKALRRLHTGFITDYLVWCLLGLALLFVVLMVGR